MPPAAVPIPDEFLRRMAALLGDAYPAFRASYDAPASVGLRVNTLKLSPAAFRTLTALDLTPIPWCDAGFIIGPHPSAPAASRTPPPSLAGKGVGG